VDLRYGYMLLCCQRDDLFSFSNANVLDLTPRFRLFECYGAGCPHTLDCTRNSLLPVIYEVALSGAFRKSVNRAVVDIPAELLQRRD
jgi:hypothetical protein